ncbi:helix-turn-helix domain-containing protein [Pedobacter sp. NJ-S-72]
MEALKNKYIGNNIRSIRQLKGIKQGVLAEMLGVKQQSVSKMERRN